MAKDSKKIKYPKASKNIDYIQVASFKSEFNDCLGQHWIELWLIKGNKDGGPFVQYADPNTGEIAYYLKLEDGNHPLMPGTALGKCDDCGYWYQQTSGACTQPSCSGEIQSYDGFTRFGDMTTDNNKKILEEFEKIVFDFLIAELIPNPLDFEEEIYLLELDEE